MAVFMRLRAIWGGAAVVGGGVSTFHAATGDEEAFRLAVEKLYAAIKDQIPVSAYVTIPNTGEMVEVETGNIEGIWTSAEIPYVVTGLDTGGYAAGVGARVVWNTNARTHNTRVRGSTFIVPLGNTAYDSDGTLLPAVVTKLQSGAGQTISTLGGEALTIWTRPINGEGGKGSAVVSATVPDRVSWLRSRRT